VFEKHLTNINNGIRRAKGRQWCKPPRGGSVSAAPVRHGGKRPKTMSKKTPQPAGLWQISQPGTPLFRQYLVTLQSQTNRQPTRQPADGAPKAMDSHNHRHITIN
jgi:hypothetical protein